MGGPSLELTDTLISGHRNSCSHSPIPPLPQGLSAENYPLGNNRRTPAAWGNSSEVPLPEDASVPPLNLLSEARDLDLVRNRSLLRGRALSRGYKGTVYNFHTVSKGQGWDTQLAKAQQDKQ